nr:hypothetical protein [Tanacetum cinerariifolium]
AQKVPVVDYQIVVIDNKSRYKIKRSDDTHQLYISFTTLLKNFDREDLEALWKIARDRFSTSKPTNFSDEYLLLTLKTMFEEPEVQDAIWRNQKSVHGLALVKRWKLLTSCEEELGAEQVQVDAAVAAGVVEDVAEDVAHVVDTCFALLRCVEHLEHDNVAQRLEIVKLKARVKKLEQTDKVKSSKFRRLRKVEASRQVESSDDMEDVFNQGRMVNEDKGIELVKDAEIAESEGRQADKQAEIYNIDLDHSSKVLIVIAAASQVSAASATIPAAKPSIPAAAPTVVAAYTRRRKGVTIRDPEEELPLKTPAETSKVKDKGKGILVEAPKPMKKKDQIEIDAEYARKLQEEIDRDHDGFNKDIDWDAAMDHVNQKSSIKRGNGSRRSGDYQSINETPVQKAAKRRKLSEEAQEAKDLRKRLEVVEDEDDD